MHGGLHLFPRSRRTATRLDPQLPAAANHTDDMGTHTSTSVMAAASSAATTPAETTERDMMTSLVSVAAGSTNPGPHLSGSRHVTAVTLTT